MKIFRVLILMALALIPFFSADAGEALELCQSGQQLVITIGESVQATCNDGDEVKSVLALDQPAVAEAVIDIITDSLREVTYIRELAVGATIDLTEGLDLVLSCAAQWDVVYEAHQLSQAEAAEGGNYAEMETGDWILRQHSGEWIAADRLKNAVTTTDPIGLRNDCQ